MKDKVFIDTNIFIYAFLNSSKDKNDYNKHILSKEFLSSFQNNQKIIISTQVCNEYYSALLKHKISDDEIQKSLKELISAVKATPVTQATVLSSFNLKKRYKYSYWDSLILSSALENDCKIIYTEDMKHQQMIEDKVQIINPFK